MTVRECKVSDYFALTELNSVEMGYSLSLEETKKRLEFLVSSVHDKIYVAEDDNKVIGYVHINDYDLIYMPHMKNIMGIAVFSEYKRRGIGTALLKKAEEWARETGAVGIRLVSGSTRTGAHQFYRSLGYGNEKQQINFKKMF